MFLSTSQKSSHFLQWTVLLCFKFCLCLFFLGLTDIKFKCTFKHQLHPFLLRSTLRCNCVQSICLDKALLILCFIAKITEPHVNIIAISVSNVFSLHLGSWPIKLRGTFPHPNGPMNFCVVFFHSNWPMTLHTMVHFSVQIDQSNCTAHL